MYNKKTTNSIPPVLLYMCLLYICSAVPRSPTVSIWSLHVVHGPFVRYAVCVIRDDPGRSLTHCGFRFSIHGYAPHAPHMICILVALLIPGRVGNSALVPVLVSHGFGHGPGVPMSRGSPALYWMNRDIARLLRNMASFGSQPDALSELRNANHAA
jgi:hypothetical protein